MWIAQLLISFIVIVFCMLMISLNHGALEVYLPLITSTAAVWIPSPKTPTRNVPTVKTEREAK